MQLHHFPVHFLHHILPHSKVFLDQFQHRLHRKRYLQRPFQLLALFCHTQKKKLLRIATIARW